MTHFFRDAVDVGRSHPGGGANRLAVVSSILLGIIVCMFSARGRDIVSRLAASVARSWRHGLYLFMKDRTGPRQISHSDNHPDDEPDRSPLDEWQELTAVLRQGERAARAEGERAISAAIRDLHEAWLSLLEALRQRIRLDRLDPLDAVAQIALDAGSSGSDAPLMRKIRPRATSAGARRCGSVRIRRLRERTWLAGSVAKPWTEPWSGRAHPERHYQAPLASPRRGAATKIHRQCCDLCGTQNLALRVCQNKAGECLAFAGTPHRKVTATAARGEPRRGNPAYLVARAVELRSESQSF